MKNKVKIKTITPAYWGFVIVFLMILVDQYFDLCHIPDWVYTTLSTMIFIFCREDIATQYYAMLVPFANAIHIQEISMFYFMVIGYKMLAGKQGLVFHTNTFLAYALIIALQIIACIRCDDLIATAVYLVTIMGSVMIWGKLFYDEDTCVSIIKSYMLSFAIMVIFMFFLTLKLVPLEKFLDGDIRLGHDAYFARPAFNTGANGLGMMSLFNASLACVLFWKKRILTPIAVCMWLLCGLTGLMTQSRAFLVGAVFLILYLCFFYSSSVIRSLIILVAVAIVAVSVLLIMNRVNANLLLRFAERFDTEDITNGRVDIMSDYFARLAERPVAIFIGTGLTSYREVLKGGGATAHNGTQEVLLAWGVIGLIAVTGWFISLVQSRELKFVRKGKMRTLLPLFMLLLMVQSTRMFSTFSSIFLVGIALLCIVPTKEQKGEKYENFICST